MKSIRSLGTILMVLAVGVLLVAVVSRSQEQKEMKGDVAEVALKQSVERGKALFFDPELGTSGMTCNSCHLEGGAKTNPTPMKGMTMRAFDHLNAKYPKYFPMAEKVMTLPQVVNFCVINPLKGKALTLDDQKLVDLTAYIASVKPLEEKEEK